ALQRGEVEEQRGVLLALLALLSGLASRDRRQGGHQAVDQLPVEDAPGARVGVVVLPLGGIVVAPFPRVAAVLEDREDLPVGAWNVRQDLPLPGDQQREGRGL